MCPYPIECLISLSKWLTHTSTSVADPDHKRNMAHTMMRAAQRSLTAESLQRLEVAADYIGAYLETTQVITPDIQGD